MLDIALLGTGALSPAPDRALSAAWLACCGHAILLDCGEGTQTAARRAGVSLMKIDLIALTHYHGDHIFGLPGLLQTMQAQERLSPLFITGPEGLSSVLEPILRLTGPLAFEVRPIPPFEGALPLCDLASGWPAQARLSRFPTRHRVLSQGYRFALGRSGKFDAHKARALGVPVECWRLLQQGQDAVLPGRVVHPEAVIGPERPGLRVVFTGDTARCAPLVEAARGADLLICDATYGEAGQ
ncbi:MAG: MBL fold metallo-hydrolase [Clostridia bacterium]|nr:MBL fold metallo-hydrolase [Clostridia bacterium]